MKTNFSLTGGALAEAGGPQPRWLIVDDAEEILELLALLLRRIAPVEICRARSAAEALAMVAAAAAPFTFVVTDLEMPGMNGIELCRALHAAAPAVPVLLATGSARVSAEAARGLGFCGMLAKPFSPAELSRAVVKAGVLGEPEGKPTGEPISSREAALAA
jgi:two-component system response regulator FlrC